MAELLIAERTAGNHVEHSLTKYKLGFQSRAQIAAWAVSAHKDGLAQAESALHRGPATAGAPVTRRPKPVDSGRSRGP